MEMNCCRRCGEKLKNIEKHVFTCSNKHLIFRNSSPCAGIILINENKQFLVTIRSIEPWKGKLHIPAGFCDDNETFEQTLEREIFEEIGLLKNDYGMPKYLTSVAEPYEYKGEEIPVLVAIYWAEVSSKIKLVPGDDASDALFMSYDELDIDKVAFQAQKQGLIKLHKLGII